MELKSTPQSRLGRSLEDAGISVTTRTAKNLGALLKPEDGVTNVKNIFEAGDGARTASDSINKAVSSSASQN